MAITYNQATKKWDISYAKTDNNTSRPIAETVSITRKVPEVRYVNGRFTTVYVEKTATVNVNGGYWDIINALNAAGIPNPKPWEAEKALEAEQSKAKETNVLNQNLNQEAKKLNEQNQAKNKAYDDTVKLAQSSAGGDYVAVRDKIRALPGVDSSVIKTLEDSFKSFYQTEKLQPWDSRLGSKPPYGDFDPNYYKTRNQAVARQWADAVANDDLDIIGRYTEQSFYLQHYTTQGKAAGLRGNEAEQLQAASKYVEKTPTDLDTQAARTLQLGIDLGTQTNRLLSVPEIAKEWEKAKEGDSYWKDLAKQNFLDVNKEDDFAALFRLSNRPQDKQVAFNYNANAGYGITELEDAINQAAGAKAQVDTKKFGALTQDVLRQTINEMKKAKAKEQGLAMLSGLGSFSEIMNINKELSNSILGDTGIGGMFSFMGGNKAQESLEKALVGVTGVNNNAIYNWQQWFDTQLKTRYQEDLELGLSQDEASERIRIEGEFARNFIDEYLIPRFNESKSMNEFMEYLDVRQEEKNPFQTQELLDAVKSIADRRAEAFIKQIEATPDRYFDANFYFNPTGNKGREADYLEQTKTVNEDWEAAKRGDPYWAQQAYRFGADVNNKESFARMHFQVKGQGKGYDAADDILNASKVSDYIYNEILPALEKKALDSGTIFGQFLLPDEFADKMLQGLDPADKETWNEVLKLYGLDTFTGTIDDLKAYIAEALRTGSAQEIREQIKFLNEKGEKPTQKILGTSYIERPEDFKGQKAKPETELYKIFQSAGFQGSEDDFYDNFFPDLDRSEMSVLTKAGSKDPLKMAKFDFSDPFASLGTIESFFDSDEKSSASTSTSSSSSSSYFRLDDDVFRPEKTKAGQGFLDDFTSMFKF